MHDIDSILNKVSGQSNYMDSLSKVIGNILHIDTNIYAEKAKQISGYISTALRSLDEFGDDNGAKFKEIRETLRAENEKINIEKKCLTEYKRDRRRYIETGVQRLPRYKVTDGYRPKELLKTKWFETIKNIDKTANELLEKLQYDNAKNLEENWPIIETHLNASTNARDVLTFFDAKLYTKREFIAMVLGAKHLDNVINILLMPLYDYEKTIHKNWGRISMIFKIDDTITPDTIMNILSQFVIAKYRVEITGSNKHYMRLFSEMLSTEMADDNFDGTKFLRIVDSIDLDKISSSSKASQFVEMAKPIMRRLVDKNNNESMENILAEIQTIIDQQAKPPEKINEAAAENADVF